MRARTAGRFAVARFTPGKRLPPIAFRAKGQLAKQ
jgi:hypothetical protein